MLVARAGADERPPGLDTSAAAASAAESGGRGDADYSSATADGAGIVDSATAVDTAGQRETGAAAPHAQSESQGAIVGCCVVLLKVLGAVLPPPFPSNQPARLYIGNLAVRSEYQRRGYGRALLNAIEKLGAHLHRHVLRGQHNWQCVRLVSSALGRLVPGAAMCAECVIAAATFMKKFPSLCSATMAAQADLATRREG